MKLQKETKLGAVHGKWYDDACAAAFAMELIGERWTLPIVRELMLGARRFSDIRAELPGLSAKVLTERLERLEEVGVLTRRKLPPPAASRVFELTGWGYELEDVMQALGRWSVRSPLHDPNLPLTPVSFMLSLRTMLDPAKAGALSATVLFEVGENAFFGTLEGGQLSIRRAAEGDARPDLAFRAPSASHYLPVFYGKRSAEEAGVSLEIVGDADLADAFIDLFSLPPKCV